jgi:hypothetical protein
LRLKNIFSAFCNANRPFLSKSQKERFMSIDKYHFAIMLLAMTVTACNAQNESQYDQKPDIMNSKIIPMNTLTITKVKKPWYAWKGLVLRKMRESIPEYTAAPGLVFKYYTFTEDQRYLGGIYLWKSEQDASNWFNQAWFDRTEKKYGEKGVVMRFTIKDILTLANPASNEGKYFAALSDESMQKANLESHPGSLLQVIDLIDEKNTPFRLSLWENKNACLRFLDKTSIKSEYFEVPILLSIRK